MKSIGLLFLLFVLPCCYGLNCLTGSSVTTSGTTVNAQVSTMCPSGDYSCLRVSYSSGAVSGSYGSCVLTSSCSSQTCSSFSSFLSGITSDCTTACCTTDDCNQPTTTGAGTNIQSMSWFLCLSSIIAVLFNRLF